MKSSGLAHSTEFSLMVEKTWQKEEAGKEECCYSADFVLCLSIPGLQFRGWHKTHSPGQAFPPQLSISVNFLVYTFFYCVEQFEKN